VVVIARSLDDRGPGHGLMAHHPELLSAWWDSRNYSVAGGYRHYLKHLGPSQEARWKTLGHPRLTEEVVDRLVSGLDEAVGETSVDELARRR
jgi:hypothetical protein